MANIWSSIPVKIVRAILFIPIGLIILFVLQAIPIVLFNWIALKPFTLNWLSVLAALFIVSIGGGIAYFYAMLVFFSPMLTCKIIAPWCRVATIIFGVLFVVLEFLWYQAGNSLWFLIYNMIFTLVVVSGLVVSYATTVEEKRATKVIGVVCGALIVLVFIANHCIRVATPEKDYGIIEELVMGRPLTEALAPPWSDNYKRWEASTKFGNVVADLIQQHGIADLALIPKLTEQRQLAQRMSEAAYTNAIAIPAAYLAASNPDLPKAYFGNFVPAMDCWRHGFADSDLKLVRQGVSNYNAFLVWIQSCQRSDFKGMR